MKVMLALRAPRSSFSCAMLMCSRLNLCKSSVGTFAGTESIYKNASTPPTWRAGFRKQDPAILTPCSRRVALSNIQFLHDDGGEKKIIKLCSLLMQSPNVLYRGRGGTKSTSVRLSAAEQTCPYDAHASIFKSCMSAVYPVSREHVTALNMSVRLCAGQEGDADSGASLPPRSARHFRSSQCRCDPFPEATPYLAELPSKFLFLYIP